MATVSLLSPHATANMTSHRAPLRDAPSAVLNSPLRGASTALLGSKRPRQPTVSLGEHAAYNESQMSKRRFVETDEPSLRLHGLPPKRSAQATTLQRRLEAARVPPPSRSKSTAEQAETVRQWQKHYRRIFPNFVFFFDNVQDESRKKFSTQIRLLGAREEAFFQKSVTHVVTTRSIPPVDAPNSSISITETYPTGNNHTRTINPLLLDNQQRNGHKFTFEAPLGRKMPATNDILLKARDMGMKIWTMDKITRILHTLAPTDSDIVTTDTRQPYGKERPNREAELSRLLREDKRYASSDKSWMFDMMPFRGYHVYVRDMDERSKPVMIRDYPKPASKEQGKWPQLRVSPLGRCPFIEEQPSRRAIEPVRRTTVEQVKARSRSITMEATQTQDRLESREALAERANPPEMPPPVKRSSTDQLPLFGSAQASLRRVPRFVQGEPIASGVQPSNITSAVRSQMISSTAALPGGKGGSSRELNNLKRKILEKNGAGDVAFINNHIRAAINEDSGRPTKRKMLDDIVEDTAAHQQRVSRKKRVVEKELKPGYCENCRDKYADFDEHILSKEHRKFAVNNEHFRDLDTLLEKLQRI